ncbi:adenosine receptor A2b-like [Oculina patagonica]
MNNIVRRVGIMKKSSCEVVLQYVPSIAEHEDLRSTYILNCVLNIFLSYTAVALNAVTIHAIRKTWSLPKPLRTLLLSLAVSDVGVGLMVQPFLISFLVKWLQSENPGCVAYKLFFMIMSLFALASFFGVVLISLDRFLAIHLHLRYQELVTHKRVVAVVISVWVFSATLSLITVWYPSEMSLTIFAVGVICLMLTTLIFGRIFLVFRRHKEQIQALQVQQGTHSRDVANVASLMKSAVGIFYVYLVFMVCYLPRGGSLVATAITEPNTALKEFLLYSWTLVFLNSSLNPVIYCWKMRHIRHAIMDILRNLPRHRSVSFRSDRSRTSSVLTTAL